MTKKRKVLSFATRLTRWIILTQLVCMGIVSYVVYSLVEGIVVEEETSLYEEMRDNSVGEIRRILSDFYVGTINHIPEIEQNLNHPDSLLSIMERVVNLNSTIRSCGVCFVDNYYPQYGRLCRSATGSQH